MLLPGCCLCPLEASAKHMQSIMFPCSPVGWQQLTNMLALPGCPCFCLQINCGSIAPITASQFGTNRFMEKLLMQRSGTQELGTMGRFGCAAVAGTVSALVASPTELIIIQQQVRVGCVSVNLTAAVRALS